MDVWLKVEYTEGVGSAPLSTESKGELAPEELVNTVFRIGGEERERFVIRLVPPEERIPLKPVLTIRDLVGDLRLSTSAPPLLRTLREAMLRKTQGMRIAQIAECFILPEDEIKDFDVPSEGLRVVLSLCQRGDDDFRSTISVFGLRSGELLADSHIQETSNDVFGMDICNKNLYLFESTAIIKVCFKLRVSTNSGAEGEVIPPSKIEGVVTLRSLPTDWRDTDFLYAVVVDKTTSPQTFICLTDVWDYKGSCTVRRVCETAATSDDQNIELRTVFSEYTWEQNIELVEGQMSDLDSELPTPQSVRAVAIDQKGRIWINYFGFIAVFSPDLTCLSQFRNPNLADIYPSPNGDVHIRCRVPTAQELDLSWEEEREEDDEQVTSDSDDVDILTRPGSGSDEDEL